MGENRFLYQGIKYNIFGLIPTTSYVTQTLNIKYRGTVAGQIGPKSNRPQSNRPQVKSDPDQIIVL